MVKDILSASLDWGEEENRTDGQGRAGRNGIGLVLSGGGAKGAYQAGVWQAMCELGLADRVVAISGTSVGALNATGFAVLKDPEAICRVWTDHVGEIATPNLQALAPDAFLQAAENVLAGKAFPFHGLLDRSALERLVRKLIPDTWPRVAPPVYVTALEILGGLLDELKDCAYRLRRFRLDRDRNPARRVQKVLASAAIPWGFDPVEIDGRRHVDGGWDAKGGENLPIRPIFEHHPEIRTIIAVRCNSAEVEPEPIRVRLPIGTELVEVRPSTTLPGVFGDVAGMLEAPLPILAPLLDPLSRLLKSWGGTFAFSPDFAGQYIRRGHADGLATLRNLEMRQTLKW